jgi:hypothetical protein
LRRKSFDAGVANKFVSIRTRNSKGRPEIGGRMINLKDAQPGDLYGHPTLSPFNRRN